MRKITIKLSDASINAAIKELQSYNREINRKVQRLLDLMVRHGEDYAINQVGRFDSGETVSSIHGYRDGNKGVIVAGGNAIWIEFGSGVRFNGPVGSSPHPKGQELGMTIGEYPGEFYAEHGVSQGANPKGWYYYDEGGALKFTRGIKANMFMWHTARELERIAPELSREVFGK